ncbi:hypothetical protein Rsw2DRAFT_2517 [Rhodobacter ferrooxidans]|uniref:Uncharacterized protein n=2 Tax=Rhodobacter ferrooxidans TaxID=371731 RepID=C8S389_9RHOB|nr:hypothetical protein Rsw2DRAFT_2517 [Rhodobacter sp. SW2]
MLLILSLVVTAASAFGVRREYGGAIFAIAGAAPNVTALAQTAAERLPVPLPLTWSGQKALLATCVEMQVSLLLALQAGPARSGVHRACDALAQDSLQMSPTFGMAHLVAAQAASARGDAVARDAALVQGQAFAPTEGWQALRRIELGLSGRSDLGRSDLGAPDLGPPDLDPTAQAALARDLRFVLATDWGSLPVARLYAASVRRPPLIEAALRDLPGSAQAAFLDHLRRLAKPAPSAMTGEP